MPRYGGVRYLKTLIVNAGGTDVTDDPQPGDICFIDWSCAGGYGHVEIVYQVIDGLVYTIGGNSSSAPNLYSRIVRKHAPVNGGEYGDCVTCIIRPNYKAVSIGYIDRCIPRACFRQLTAIPGARLWTLPAQDTLEASSESPSACAEEGEELIADRLFENTAGEYWYRVQKNGAALYLFAGDADAGIALWDVEAQNAVSPGNLAPGSGYSLQGTVSSSKLSLTQIGAFVYRGSAVSGTPAAGTAVSANTGCYYLNLSPVDLGTAFGELAVGRYTLAYTAVAENCYSQDGAVLASESRSFPQLCALTFYVGGGSVMGDVDGDGQITAADALTVLRRALNDQYPVPFIEAADADASGSVDAADALVILRAALGDYPLPVPTRQAQFYPAVR